MANPTPGGGTSTAATFQVLATPSTVYVNTTYAGDPLGTAVTWTDGSKHFVGYDAFGTVQAGVTAVASGGTVHLAAGTYVEQVTITQSLTLAGAGSSVTTIQAPANFLASDDEVTIASGASVTMSGFFVEKPGGDSGLNSGTGIADDGGTLTATDLLVFGFTTGIAVENQGAATITDSTIFDNDFGIVVDSSASGTSSVTAQSDSLAGDNVGVLESSNERNDRRQVRLVGQHQWPDHFSQPRWHRRGQCRQCRVQPLAGRRKSRTLRLSRLQHHGRRQLHRKPHQRQYPLEHNLGHPSVRGLTGDPPGRRHAWVHRQRRHRHHPGRDGPRRRLRA